LAEHLPAFRNQQKGKMHANRSKKGRQVTQRVSQLSTFQTDRLWKRVARLSVLLLAWQVCAQTTGPTFPNPGDAHMSRDNQRALGLQAAAQVYQQMPVLPDSSPETLYIRQLGQRLVGTIPPEYSWPFEFHVVAQKEINAFALPGGPMFVNIGTITAAANEAQLAGVMAHEMSHVYMQHSAKQAHKDETTDTLAGIADAALGATVGGKAGGMVGQLGQMGIQLGAQGLTLKHSRSDESQADAVGAMILYKAGYNPQAMADFFKTLEVEGGKTPPQWLSDHPNPGNREQAIEKEIRNWSAQSYAGDSAAFQKVRQHTMEVKAYTGEEIAKGAKSGEWAALNKKNGATFNSTVARAANASALASAPTSLSNEAVPSPQSVLPSQRMVTANLGPVKIEHPENWQVMMPQEQGHFVTIAPRAGITANGVGYGVLLNGFASPQGVRIDIDDVTRQLVQGMQQNGGLQPVGDAQPITIGGMQGRAVSFQSTSPFPTANGQPQKERDWLVVIPQPDGSVIFLIFVAPQSDFDRFEPTYEAMLKSLRF
jgi:predicted Zn-dependent protease